MKKKISWQFRLPLYIGLYLAFYFLFWLAVGDKMVQRIMQMSSPYHIRVQLYLLVFSVAVILIYLIGELLCRQLGPLFGSEESNSQEPFIVLTHFFLYTAYYLELSDSMNLIGQVMLFDDNDTYRACYRHYMTCVVLALVIATGLSIWQISRAKMDMETKTIRESFPRVFCHLALFLILVLAWPFSLFGEKSSLFETTISSGRLRAQYICFALCFLTVYYLGEWLYRKLDSKKHSFESLFPSAWTLVLYLFLYYSGLYQITRSVDNRFLSYELDSNSIYHVENPLLRDGRLAWLWFAYGTVAFAFFLIILCKPGRNTDFNGESDSQQNRNILFCFSMMEFIEAGKKDHPAAAELNRAAIDDVKNGRLDDAFRKFKACIDVYPKYMAAQCNLGTVLGLQKNYTQAEECFMKANLLAYHHPTVMRGMALCKFLQGDYESCLKTCKEYGTLFADEKLYKLQECCRINLGKATEQRKGEQAEDLLRAVISAKISDTEKPDYAQRMENTAQKRDILFRGQRFSDPNFGYEPTNPIMTSTIDDSENYLNRLRTFDGKSFTWERVGSYSMREIHGVENVMVDIYQLYLNGEEYSRLYICPYGHNSSFAPKSMELSDK